MFCECGCGGLAPIAEQTCIKKGWIKGEPKRFIHGHNRRSSKPGYPAVLMPMHLRASARGYVHEHILIAEKALGKPLPPGVVVHHVNGSKNSGPLMVCQDQAYHLLLHQRQRAYEACGYANWRKCSYCKTYDVPENLFISKNNTGSHHKCRAKYQYDRRHEDCPVSIKIKELKAEK